MQLGTLALALVFILSGAKNLQNSGIFSKDSKTDTAKGSNDKKSVNDKKEASVFLRRQFGFGIMLVFIGVLTLIYYIVVIL